ncbi:MAG: hypothetical protein GX846_07635 [Deltaproteobacteria bacterium]|nr:hypothetical protein [Deltaproteobacteria bacterium]
MNLRNNPQFDDDLLSQIDRLRRFRNQLVHPSGEIGQTQVPDYMKLLDEVAAKFEKIGTKKVIQQTP